MAGAAYRHSNRDCGIVSRISAYHSLIGVMAAFITKEHRLDRIIVAENKNGIILKPALSDHYNNPMDISNIYITPLARPSCEKCYK